MLGSRVEEVREEAYIRHDQDETNSTVTSSAISAATLTTSQQQYLPQEVEQQRELIYQLATVVIPYFSFTRDKINTNMSATAAAIKSSPPSIHIRPDAQLNNKEAANEGEDIILQEGKKVVRFDDRASIVDGACSTAASTIVYTPGKTTSATATSKARPTNRLNSLAITRRMTRSDTAAAGADTASRKQ
ncbi:hypothetical protein BG015_008121 [Linnemannia schmuckeri]|uniref:Uncharacterized protein n=1 Tax=Linnemannia schmuckeri TaxID=64567 RepID=A0A9P5VAS0_9FUNG|nr:hypothetical protein BG015_008121 [Linnemannia schmuckeri]